jgi:hypothetical protein
MHLAPPAPPCPKCGLPDSKAIAKQYDYPMGSNSWNSEPDALRYTYQCQCGTAFTHSVKELTPAESNGKPAAHEKVPPG